MKVIEKHHSGDAISHKVLQKAADGHIIETGIFDLDEETFCISTQVGCPLGCAFCSSTLPVDAVNPDKAFIRNLTKEEIVSQVKNAINKSPIKRDKDILLSYMGIGEPFLNYYNVVASIKELATEEKRVKRVTIATTGVAPEKIMKFAEEHFPGLEVKIQLSLHAPNQKKRKALMPNAGDFTKALEATYYYAKKTNQRIKINYMLIEGVNDGEKDALELGKLISPKKDFLTVKLMRLNENPEIPLKASERFGLFERVLNSMGINISLYVSDGRDIKSNCGQLRRYYYG